MFTIDAVENIQYNINGLALSGLAYGNKDDEPLLCLHGWLDNAASFIPLMPYIPNRRIIAIDWPGHGFSSHRTVDAYYHFIDWVYDLLQLFEINQWTNIDIVAHSMGAMVSSAFSAAYPEKVKSLTLIDSIGFLCIDAEETTQQLRQGLNGRLKRFRTSLEHSTNISNKETNKPIKKVKNKTLYPTIDAAINARVLVSDMSYDEAKIIVERGIIQEGEHYIWRSDSRLRLSSPYRFTLPQAEQLIKDIKCPVQLIYGDSGSSRVAAGMKNFVPLFQQLSTYQLAGGHHVHMEQPQATTTLINAFLANNA